MSVVVANFSDKILFRYIRQRISIFPIRGYKISYSSNNHLFIARAANKPFYAPATSAIWLVNVKMMERDSHCAVTVIS